MLTPNLSKNQIEIEFVTLPDSSCTSCASVIEYHYNKLAGIEVAINFATRKAQFKYEMNKWNRTKINRVMQKLGYQIAETTNQLDVTHEHSSAEHRNHILQYHRVQRWWANFAWWTLLDLALAIMLLMPLLLARVIPLTTASWLHNVYLQLGCTTIIQFYLGRGFYLGCFRELVKQKWPGMNTLVVFATLTAYSFSIYLMSRMENAETYFEVSGSIIVIVLIGDVINKILQTKATNDFDSLFSLVAKTAMRITPSNQNGTVVNVEDLAIGDILLVRSGESVPTDGQLISTNALLNEALVSGESVPVTKTTNADLIGGTINVGASFQMQVTKLGKTTVLSQIITAIETTQAQKPKLQKLADRIAGIFIPTILLLALLVFLLRFLAFHQTAAVAIETAISTLIIACPCALGIATPLAVAVGVNKAAKRGIIYHQTSIFETVKQIDTICFDKTGTLTTNQLTITNVIGEQQYLGVALALEQHSRHPIAHAFQQYQTAKAIVWTEKVTNVQEITGFGMVGKYQNQNVTMAALGILEQQNFQFSEILARKMAKQTESATNIIALAIEKTIVLLFTLEATTQPAAQQVIQQLQATHYDVILISGDQLAITKQLATDLKIATYYAETKPIAKADIVKQLQAAGKKVAFVGDGINDSIALQQADLAIAMGQGSDLAQQNSDVTILNNDLTAVIATLRLTKQTRNNILINFIWAFGYNLIIIPLAMFGLILPPLAALAMALSDLALIVNAIIFKLRK